MITFSQQECNKIIELSSILEKFRRDKHSTVDPRPVEDIRFTYWRIPYSESTRWIFSRFDKVVEYHTEHKVLKTLDFINLHRYTKGDKFSKHKDIYYPGQIFNVGCNLNSNYKGGEFKLYSPDIIAGETPGELYLFENNRYHEITEITDGERWSIIGFYNISNLDFKGNLI